ncbi:MAG: rhomboid family intramembrane serine protease [Pseudomonadota bacterium]
MDQDRDASEGLRPAEHEPFFNPVPPFALCMAGFILAIELILQAGVYGLVGDASAVGWRAQLIERFGFSALEFERMMANGLVTWEKFVKLVTYPVLSSGFREALIGSIFMVALGKYVVERAGPFPIAVLLFGGAIVGALGYVIFLDEEAILSGPLSLAFTLLGFYAFRQLLAAIVNGTSKIAAVWLPIFILSIDIVLAQILDQPDLWVARACSLVFGFFTALFIDWRGGFSWAIAQFRIRKFW